MLTFLIGALFGWWVVLIVCSVSDANRRQEQSDRAFRNQVLKSELDWPELRGDTISTWPESDWINRDHA